MPTIPGMKSTGNPLAASVQRDRDIPEQRAASRYKRMETYRAAQLQLKLEPKEGRDNVS